MAPDVASMLIVYVPAGVPAGVPVAPPPLHATQNRIKPAANTSVAPALRPRFVPAVHIPKSSRIDRQLAHRIFTLRIIFAGGATRIPLGGTIVRSAVETLTVTEVPPLDGVTGFTEKLHAVPFGSPLQLMFTG